MKRIYIAGPMTGIEDLNRAEFEAARLRLLRSEKEWSVYVTVPHFIAYDECWDESTPLNEIASVLISNLVNCDAVYMLRGWEQSKGAMAEHAVAVWIGLEIIYQGGEG